MLPPLLLLDFFVVLVFRNPVARNKVVLCFLVAVIFCRRAYLKEEAGTHPVFHLVPISKTGPMNGESQSPVSAAIQQVLELSADAHIARRLTVKESPAFYRLTGVIAAYGKALELLVALQKQ